MNLYALCVHNMSAEPQKEFVTATPIYHVYMYSVGWEILEQNNRPMGLDALLEIPTWPWAKASDPDGVKIELILAPQAAVPETWADFQNSYIWA